MCIWDSLSCHLNTQIQRQSLHNGPPSGRRAGASSRHVSVTSHASRQSPARHYVTSASRRARHVTSPARHRHVSVTVTSPARRRHVSVTVTSPSRHRHATPRPSRWRGIAAWVNYMSVRQDFRKCTSSRAKEELQCVAQGISLPKVPAQKFGAPNTHFNAKTTSVGDSCVTTVKTPCCAKI